MQSGIRSRGGQTEVAIYANIFDLQYFMLNTHKGLSSYELAENVKY
jgi:hypothetical protein